MKQQINPVVTIVCVVVALVILIFLGIRTLNPSAPAASGSPSQTASRPKEINGHAVPNNVPYDYLQRSANAGPSGSGMGVAPRDMPGAAPGQLPPHP